ncbi:hypothetical protein GCM10009609_71710 [Pseudonocardia aurantiaca]|uniref:Uncharacterized protein n=1 Tax=Pseudonocardia aurantiaca TaxID=75290 RepID=A0ABW4FYU9_9PSEU
MDGLGLLFIGAVLGCFLCAKCKSASGAVVFALVAATLFVAAPVGRDVPDAVADLLNAVNHAFTPVLAEDFHKGSGAVG